VFENRVLRRIFGPKVNEVRGEWRRLHNEELNNLDFAPNIMQLIKSRRMSGTCSRYRREERCLMDFGRET
jgi:hypothetical protein